MPWLDALTLAKADPRLLAEIWQREGPLPVLVRRATGGRLFGFDALDVDAEGLGELAQDPAVLEIRRDRPLLLPEMLPAKRSDVPFAPPPSPWRAPLLVFSSGLAPSVWPGALLLDLRRGWHDALGRRTVPADDAGHGTFLVSALAPPTLAGADGSGVPAPLFVARVLGRRGGRESHLLEALGASLERLHDGFAVALVAVAWEEEEGPLEAALARLAAHGVLVVRPAGSPVRATSPAVLPYERTAGPPPWRRRQLAVGRLGGSAFADVVLARTALDGAVPPRTPLADALGPGRRRLSGGLAAAAAVAGLLVRLSAGNGEEARALVLARARDLGLPLALQGQGRLTPTSLAHAPPPGNLTAGARLVVPGEVGYPVWCAQNRLNLLGLDVGRPADGWFDEATAAAVARFEAREGLPVTGGLTPYLQRLLARRSPLGGRSLAPPARGADVAALRRRLGLPPGECCDRRLTRRVAALQGAAGLVPDGVADERLYFLLGRLGAHPPRPSPGPLASPPEAQNAVPLS